MIMKANKQIGFIYKNNESIDKILKDGDVVFERGFLREKTSTTLPITFGGVGKDLKDYRVYGNTVQKILPDEYTQVEYIKNTGLQYIDTGVYGNLNTEIRVKASNNGESAQLFGDITTQSRAISCNFSFGGAVGSRFGNKSVAAILGNYITTDIPFELIENKNGMYIDNVEVIAFDTTDEFTTTNTLLLLNRNSSSGANANRGFGNLYNCEIYDGNTLIRNFIPCYRNSDNEVGLYDLVNNVFYTNQGTGVFTYGSVAPTPDAPIEMVSCGDLITDTTDVNYGKYKIPINVRSDNLFDISTVTSVDNGSISDSLITSNTITQSVVQNIRPRFSTPFPFKVGTYYISADIRRKSGAGELNKINDGYVDYTKINFPNLTDEFQRYVVSHQYNADTSYADGRLLFQVASNSNQLVLEIKNIMISTSNDYIYVPYYNETTNIYLDEPLREIGEYSDYVDFINGKVVRNIKEYVFNGSENWSTYGSNLYTLQTFFNNNPFIVGYGLSNLYRYNSIQSGIANNTVNGEFALQKSNQNYNLFIKNTDIGSLENLKSALSEKNMILQYPLATPTEESITLPNIPTIDGNNTLNIETEITPSQVYIKYKSNS